MHIVSSMYQFIVLFGESQLYLVKLANNEIYAFMKLKFYKQRALKFVSRIILVGKIIPCAQRRRRIKQMRHCESFDHQSQVANDYKPFRFNVITFSQKAWQSRVFKTLP